MARSMKMIDRTQALPGRETPLTVSVTHEVLGTSMTGPWAKGVETISFGMGCFWGAERIFWQIPGVIVTQAGYQGGFTPNPTYEEVCSGRTGHAEVVQVVYDPTAVSIETLFAAFWENHDPTQGMRQGGDIGTQYRSAIYPTTAEQHQAARASLDRYQRALAERGFGEITTEISEPGKAGAFFPAEDHHQAYLHKNPGGYCNHGFCQVAYEPKRSAED